MRIALPKPAVTSKCTCNRWRRNLPLITAKLIRNLSYSRNI
jgi:hypothetical protein